MNLEHLMDNLLLTALRRDDAVRFRTILRYQGWPTYSKWSDYELLLRAIHNNSKRVAWVLLERGARIFKRQRANSALHEVASKDGWTDFAKVLLGRGAIVAELNCKGESALHIAFIYQRSIELIDLLLKAHLRHTTDVVDVVSEDGLSFLHIACTRPYLKFVSALIDRGQVDVDIQVSASNTAFAGYTPLHFAVKFGQYKVAELLLSNYNVNMYKPDANGSTPLHLATERGDVPMIDLIFRYDDCREDRCNRFSLSHFMAACVSSDESLVEDYLRVANYRSWTESDNLVRTQVKNQHNYPNAGYTPLHFAAQFGRLNTVKLLLRLGVRCCSTALNNVTPFVLAYERGHVDVCRLLSDCCKLSSKESLLTSSSMASVEPSVIDPSTICANSRHESCVGCGTRQDKAANCPSIKMSKDIELDFHEPLKDFLSDLHASNKTRDDVCSSSDIPKDINVRLYLLESSSNNTCSDVQSSLFDEQLVIFDNLFEDCAKPHDDLDSDEVECAKLVCSDE